MMTTTDANNDNKVCQNCGEAFTCDYTAGMERCWCFDLPNVLPMTPLEESSCLCPACLRAAVAQAMNAAQRELQRQHEQG